MGRKRLPSAERVARQQIAKQKYEVKKRDERNAKKRVENLSIEQIEKKRMKSRKENLTIEQIERKRKIDLEYHARKRQKREEQLSVYEPEKKIKYIDHGNLTEKCMWCGALSFPAEKSRSKFSCCHHGKIVLPTTHEYPKEIVELLYGTEEINKHLQDLQDSQDEGAAERGSEMQMAGLIGEIKQEQVDEFIPENNINQIENVDAATFPKFVYNTPSSLPPSPTAFASSSSSVSNSGNEVDAQSTKQRKHYFNKLFLVIEQERKESREDAQQFKILLDKLVDAENRKATAIENISDCLKTLTDKILNAHK